MLFFTEWNDGMISLALEVHAIKWSWPALSISAAAMYLSFCNAKREDTTHVYITSQDYPDAIPGTGQDCSCEIRMTGHSQYQLMVLNITVVSLHLFGSDNDPCRERFSVDAGRTYRLCPDRKGNEYSYIKNNQAILLPYLQVDSPSSIVLCLKTNTTSGDEQTGKVYLSVSSYGTCLIDPFTCYMAYIISTNFMKKKIPSYIQYTIILCY